jgi:hypothetical protein
MDKNPNEAQTQFLEGNLVQAGQASKLVSEWQLYDSLS